MSIKIKIPLKKNLITLPEDFATLEDVTSDGVFIYKFSYSIDVTNNIFNNKKDNPTIVNIDLIKDAPVKSSVQIFSNNLTYEEIANNILSNTSKQKDYIESKDEFIFRYKSDFTKKIPNNLTNELIKKNNSIENEKSVFSVKKTVVAKPVSELKDSYGVYPKFDVNKEQKHSSYSTNTKFNSKKIEKIKKELVIKNKIDPAMLFGLKTHSVIPVAKTMSGLSVNKKINNKISQKTLLKVNNKKSFNNFNINEKKVLNVKAPIKKVNTKHLTKIANIINNSNNILNIKKEIVNKSSGKINENNISTTKELDNTKKIAVPVIQKNSIIDIEEILEIPTSLLGYKNFKIRFELRTKDGVLLQKEERIVEHEKYDFLRNTPAIPPDISMASVSRPGNFLIELTQNDEHATTIFLYRRVIPLDEPITNSKYTLTKTIQLQKHNQPIIIKENFSSINPIIYRAVCANKFGVLCGDFASLVINQERSKIASKQSLLRRPSFVCLTYKIVNNKIELNASNIPVDCSAIQFFKRELTIKQKDFEPISEVLLLKHGKEDEITIYDQNLKDYRIYEYHVRLFYDDGHSVIANNNIVVEYEKLKKNIINLRLGPATIKRNNSILDVNFSITKEINLTDMDFVKQLLIEQNLYEQYKDDITTNKEKLQNLFFIRITRTNMITGEEEDFGVIYNDLFSDVTFSKIKNVKSLENGSVYRYTIYAHVRSTNSLIPTLEETKINKNTSYTYKPYKFKNPLTLRHGNLVSDSSMIRNHSKTQFTIGDIVDIQYIDVDLKNYRPNITNITSYKLNSNSNIVKWTINGNSDFIDHFIITLDMAGQKTVVGKCHNITSTSDFQFVDILNNGEAGSMRYGITPVFYDYSNGSEIYSNEIVI